MSDNLSSVPRTHVIGELALFGLHSHSMAREMCTQTNKCIKKIKKVGFVSAHSVSYSPWWWEGVSVGQLVTWHPPSGSRGG